MVGVNSLERLVVYGIGEEDYPKLIKAVAYLVYGAASCVGLNGDNLNECIADLIEEQEDNENYDEGDRLVARFPELAQKLADKMSAEIAISFEGKVIL